MKLHSPRFQKALRRGAKLRIKRSPALKKEFRRANKFRRYYSAAPFVRIAGCLILGGLVWGIASASGHLRTAVAMITLWTFVAVFIHANLLWTRLFRSNDLPALASLPLTEETMLCWQLQKYGRSAFWLLADLLVAFTCLAWVSKFSYLQWLASIIVALVTCAMTVTLAMLCVARVNKSYYAWVQSALWVLIFLTFASGSIVKWSNVLMLLDALSPAINSVLPTGWATSLFELLLPHPDWVLLFFLVPVVAVIGTLRNSIARFRSFYVFQESVHPPVSDISPGVVPEAPKTNIIADSASVANVQNAGITLITEIVQSRQFLAAPDWPNRGRIESLLWKWLTPRERALSEHAYPNGIAILAPWMKLLKFFNVLIGAGFILGLVEPNAKSLIIGFGMIVTFSMVLARVNDSGRMFLLMFCSGVRIPIYSNFATGILESARLLIKVSVIQAPLVLAWSVICGELITYLLRQPLLTGLEYGLRGGILLCSLRFIFLVFGFSSGTNDASAFRIRNFVLIICMGLLGVLFVVLCAAGLLLPKQLFAWGVTALAVLDAYVFFRVYAWFYNLNFFDLMNVPRQR